MPVFSMIFIATRSMYRREQKTIMYYVLIYATVSLQYELNIAEFPYRSAPSK